MESGLSQKLPITIYLPRSQVGGICSTALMAGRDIIRCRSLIWKLFVRDFHDQFRQKLFGYLWVFIKPLITIASFIFMNAAGVLKPGEMSVPYPIYVFIGVSLWSFFAATIATVSNGLLNQSDLILRTNIPKIALAVSSLAQIAYTLLAHIIALYLLMVIFSVRPSLGFIIYPILTLPLMLLGVAVGLVMSVLGSIARDLLTIIQTGLGLLMYLTPVVYMTESVHNEILCSLIALNPLTYLVEFPRNVLLYGNYHFWSIYLLICIAIFFLVLIAIKVFYLVQDLIAERL